MLHATHGYHDLNHMTDAVLPVVDAGLVDLIEPGHKICPELSLLPTPGHTPGHCSIVIESNGERAIVTGDMMHHPIQFKRPGDTLPSKDPVNQVLDYIEELKNSRVRDVDGTVVANIGGATPFECIIVCELTGQTRGLFEKSLAQNSTPDGEGYYGWSNHHHAHIRVISFKKMLRDAEIRNQAFFDQLTLGSPSLAAKKRQAKARNKKAERKAAILPAD